MSSHTLSPITICDLSHSVCGSPLTDLGHISSVTYVCHPLWFVCGHRKGILMSPLRYRHLKSCLKPVFHIIRSVDNTVSRCPGKVIGQDCYIIQEASAPWAVADTQCSRLAAIIGQPGAGRLAMPKSLQVMAQLTAYIQDIRAGKSFSERENLAAFWVGGHEEGTQFGDPAYPVWRWLSGKELYILIVQVSKFPSFRASCYCFPGK